MRTCDKGYAASVAAVVAMAACGQGAMASSAFAVRPAAQTVRYSSAQETTLYNFQGPPSDGGGGNSSLVEDKAGNFYGTTLYGGEYSCGIGRPGCGTVFKLSPSPSGGFTESVIWNFQSGQGVGPVSVIVDGSGNLYGVTQSTTPNDGDGTVFKLSPGPSAYSYTVLHAFTGGSDGSTPAGTLGFDKNGDLYGTTEFGGNGSCAVFTGQPGCGTAFELRVAGSSYTYQQIHAYQGGTDGAFPNGPVLVLPGDTILTTTAGTYNGHGNTQSQGTVSQLSSQYGQHYFNLSLYVFGYPHRGFGEPVGGVTVDSEGNIFGTALIGGKGDVGGVFELKSVKGIYQQSEVYSFPAIGPDGSYPSTGVVIDASGNLYGTTPGTVVSKYMTGGGTVFELSPQGKKYAFSLLYDFQQHAGPNGLVFGSDGALYGSTFDGGPYYGNSESGFGFIFKLTL